MISISKHRDKNSRNKVFSQALDTTTPQVINRKVFLYWLTDIRSKLIPLGVLVFILNQLIQFIVLYYAHISISNNKLARSKPSTDLNTAIEWAYQRQGIMYSSPGAKRRKIWGSFMFTLLIFTRKTFPSLMDPARSTGKFCLVIYSLSHFFLLIFIKQLSSICIQHCGENISYQHWAENIGCQYWNGREYKLYYTGVGKNMTYQHCMV